MREVLRAELKTAMRARDRVAVAALRSAIATIDNAEAVPVETPLPGASAAASEDAQQHVAGAVVGVGNSEVARRDLGEARMRELVRDRKSTRLNSSHGSSSYAVFCLKKKGRI